MRLFILCLVLFILFTSIAHAAPPSIIESEGTACMGDDKSRKQTEQAALIDAEKRAVEFVSTHIKSETDVKNFEIEKDLLFAYSHAEMKIITVLEKGWYKDASLGDCYKIKIKGEVIPSVNRSEVQLSNLELQAMCGEKAEHIFKSRYVGNNRQSKNYNYRYENHYNKRLNACFMYLDYYPESDPLGLLAANKPGAILLDVNQNKIYGTLTEDFGNNSVSCNIKDRPCENRQEWDSFVKNIMED